MVLRLLPYNTLCVRSSEGHLVGDEAQVFGERADGAAAAVRRAPLRPPRSTRTHRSRHSSVSQSPAQEKYRYEYFVDRYSSCEVSRFLNTHSHIYRRDAAAATGRRGADGNRSPICEAHADDAAELCNPEAARGRTRDSQ